MFGFRVLLHAGLLVLGCWWLMTMVPRWRNDLEILRSGRDGHERVVVIALWLITGGVGSALACYGVDWFRRVTSL